MRHFVIIGAGVAGIAAAETIRSHDPGADILLLSDDPHGYYSRPGIAYLLSGEIRQQSLFPFNPKELHLRCKQDQVVKVLPREHRVMLSKGESIPYDCLLIATGSESMRLPVPNAAIQGVVKLDTLSDVQNILALTRKARTAVVVGGGIIALEMVEGLAARGLKIHYLIRDERYWSAVLDETESRLVEGRLQAENVEIHYQTETAEILEKGSRVAGIRTKDGRQIACDILAIAIGIRPRLQIAKDCGLNTERGILVDEYLQTSQPDIFAAGDVAQVYDPLTRTAVLDGLWEPARGKGQAAGLNMLGKHNAYQKEVPYNVTRLAGLTTTIIGTVGSGKGEDLFGIARGDSETWRQLPDAIAAQSNFDVNHLRIMVGKTSILGAVLMGDQTLSQPLQHLITQHADITPIREQLLHPSAALGDVIADYWIDWKNNLVRTPSLQP